MEIHGEKERIFAFFTVFLTFFMAVIILAVSYFIFWEIAFTGFPDGYITDFDRVNIVLDYIFLGVSIPASLWFLLLGCLGWINSGSSIRKKSYTSFILYVIFVFILVVLRFCFYHILDHGQGG
ncbi:MAG: hypothetical protein LBU53_12800 [Zoogloeaceae bacterium]|jgi:hypothetical protein|nr:hypothetical protein [Zoogloeaceae bacterium]